MITLIRKILISNKKILKLLAYFFLEIIGLFLIFSIVKKAGFDRILQILKVAHFHNIFIGILVYFLAINVRAYKWKILFTISKYKVPNIFLNYFMIASLRIFIPLRTGELALPFIKKTDLRKGTAIIILDKFLEISMLLFLSILASAYFFVFFNLPLRLKNLIIISLAIVSFLIIIFILIIILKARSPKIFDRLTYLNFLRLNNLLTELIDTFKIVKNKALTLILLTGLGWALDFLSLYFIFISINPGNFIHIYASNIVASIMGAVSLIPAGIGSADLAFITLCGLKNYTFLQASSAMILLRIVTIPFLLLIGLFSFLTLHFLVPKFKDRIKS